MIFALDGSGATAACPPASITEGTATAEADIESAAASPPGSSRARATVVINAALAV
ncbi:hypothetical protein D3C74_369310 [compost metagenome]